MLKNNKKTIQKAWLDESGDAGLKNIKGSSRFFIVAMVYFNDIFDFTELELIINQLRKQFKINQNFEFKFSRSNNKLRSHFLQTINNLPFHFKSIVIDKFRVKKFNSAKSLIKYAFTNLLTDNDSRLNNAEIIIDETVVKLHQRIFNSNLKKELSVNYVKIIKHKRSKGDIRIQIADMTAGAIFHKFERSNDRFYKIIARRGKLIIVK